MTSVIGTEGSSQPYADPMLWRRLRGALEFLQSYNYPHIPNPPSCKKRASVALIIRFRPSFTHGAVYDQGICGPSTGSDVQRLENFFSQPWVQHGEPEVLFIKRASRAGDRWTSHIAFPGGGRDVQDADDCATSIRETQEEVGVDLNADHCMVVGNLPQQIVSTWWSKLSFPALMSPLNELHKCFDMSRLRRHICTSLSFSVRRNANRKTIIGRVP